MKIIVLADQVRLVKAHWHAALRVCEALNEAGHDARVWALEGNADGVVGVPVRIHGSDRMPREVARARPDVLVSTSVDTLVLAVGHGRSAGQLVHWERFPNLTRERSRKALELLGSQLDLLVVPDAATARGVAPLAAASGLPLATIPDPVAPGELPVSPGTSRLIVAAGNHGLDSGFASLISAFALAADRIPDWRLRIFGRGMQRANLAAAVRAEGLYDRVELPGASREMPLDWARAAIAVAPAETGLSLSVTEAMAAGLPVVAPDTAEGAGQRLRDGETGVLVAPRSTAELADAIVALAQDPELRLRLGAAARGEAAAYAPGRIARQWVDVLSGLPAHVDRSVAQEDPEGGERGGVADSPVIGSASPAESLRGLLGGLLALARPLSPEAFVLRPVGPRNAVLVLPRVHRQAFLEALAGPVGAGLCLSLPLGDERSVPLEVALPQVLEGVAPVVSLSAADGYAAVDVEFWREVGGALVPPRDNEWIDHVMPGSPRATVEVEGLEVPTIPLAVGPTLFDRTFPIDAVYTWVDGGDPAWQQRRDATLAGRSGISLSRASSGNARYMSRDELRYSLRSVHMFAPWVRRIFLVTDDQVPAWLDAEHPGVTLVSHRDVLDAAHLPVFNSHAIETGLHRIEGLSEHFLYLNDDVLLGRPVRPEQFFTPAGQFHAFVGAQSIGVDEESALPFQRAGLNNRRLLRERFGVTTTRVMKHTPHPLRVSTLQALEREWPAELTATAAAPFRSETDLSVASSLAQHYGMLTGAAVPAELNAAFVSLTQPNVRTVLRQLLATRSRDSICLADHHVWAWPEDLVTRELHAFLEAYYPVRGPWETPG